jgi:hypothetical protein
MFSNINFARMMFCASNGFLEFDLLQPVTFWVNGLPLKK